METYENQFAAVASGTALMRKVYAWMASGLVLTALASAVTVATPALLQLVFGNKLVFYGLVIVELGLVLLLANITRRLTGGVAALLFLAYSTLNGVTMSAIFLVYTAGSIASTFAIAAGMFGAMSLYGTLTKRDLTSWGSFLFMGLIGVLIASLVNIFLKSEMMAWVTSIAGVIVFTGLTAYDTQKIREMGWGKDLRLAAVQGALTLYLDFVNLFLQLLRLFGRRR